MFGKNTKENDVLTDRYRPREIKPRIIFKKTWTIDAIKRLYKDIKEIFK